MQPDSIPNGMVRLFCLNCRQPSVVSRNLWQRVRPTMACGHCRKTGSWVAGS
jgi:RNase P subunit RPR2